MNLKLIIIALITMGAAGCGYDDHRSESGFRHKVIIIDGCQYIQFPTYGYPAITHKGDCTNSIHKF